MSFGQGQLVAMEAVSEKNSGQKIILSHQQEGLILVGCGTAHHKPSMGNDY